MKHALPITIYYEDTDLAGIVYYANYLRYIERGRSTLVRLQGIDQLEMQRQGVVFAVRRVEADYIAPARLNDDLIVISEISALTGARMTFHQTVLRDDQLLFEAQVEVVCLTNDGRPTRFPADIRQKLALTPR